MGVLLNLTKEYFKEDIRSEDGIIINVNGKKRILKYEDHEHLRKAVPIKDNSEIFVKKEFPFLKEPIYMCCCFYPSEFLSVIDTYDYLYYYESFLENSEKVVKEEMPLLVKSEIDIFSKLCPLFDILEKTEITTSKDSLLNTLNFTENMDFWTYLNEKSFCLDVYNRTKEEKSSIRIFNDLDEVFNFASGLLSEHIVRDFGQDFTKKVFLDNYELYGDGWIKVEDVKECVKDDYNGKITILLKKKGYHEFYKELIKNGIIEKSEEYFGYDDEGNLDFEQPLFEIDDKIDEYVEHKMETTSDFIKEFASNRKIIDERYYSIFELAKLKIKNGEETTANIMSTDGRERKCEIDGVTYFVYLQI